MNKPIEIKPGVHWIGSIDPDLRVFDDLFPTERGTTYNSYLIKGSEKVAIIDTVKEKRAEEFLEKVKSLVDPAKVDYIIINHTEPDHSGSIAFLLGHCPNATVISTQAARTFLSNLIHRDFPSRVVKDGETVDLGDRTLRFVIAPYLHWPDTMFTLLEQDEMLFTCDAFGAHYCTNSIYNDEVQDYSTDMHFYFDCLIRPFKDKVISAINKISGEKIGMICPSHGPIIRKDPARYLAFYQEWAKPVIGPRKVAIFYLSPHGNTGIMANAVAKGASQEGLEVDCHHITQLSANEIRDHMEEADAMIFGTPTINRDIPKPMWDVLSYLSTVKLKGNIGGAFGSYGWSGEACKMVEDRLKGLNFKLPAQFVRSPFTPRPEILQQCEALGKTIADEILTTV
ncbi:flavo-diiron protein FprA1 [Geobacter sp. OR-1]|uniref:FprA family A-type flavoprotein n=1 Tax=Geobacter sp. OR-1 TaxID=1266765 RepID=UPI0005428C13|nr:FprA family A-type flavoprotein [Geobacter sp. OR-1]GAM09208.1 flavo-diiron protein FprA1 [Geobacter sp. OR-1]